MHLDGLLITGAMIAVLAWSARSVYEELDQDVPYIRWPMVVLQSIGYGIVAYSLVRSSSGNTIDWVIPVISAVLLSIGAMIDAVDVDVNVLSEIVQLLGYAAIAYSASQGSGLSNILIAAFSSLTLVLTKSMLLPAEKERRIALGPGMALMVIGWGMMAYALANNARSVSSAPQASVMQPTLGYAATNNAIGELPLKPTFGYRTNDGIGEPPLKPTFGYATNNAISEPPLKPTFGYATNDAISEVTPMARNSKVSRNQFTF